jgi:hypothetical protein
VTLAGIELMHMIRKGQLKAAGCLCPAQQFYSLASWLSWRAQDCSVVAPNSRQNHQYPLLDQRLDLILKADGATGITVPDRQRNLASDRPAVGSLAEPKLLGLPNDCVAVAKVAERWRSGVTVFGCHPRVTIVRLNGGNGELTPKYIQWGVI